MNKKNKEKSTIELLIIFFIIIVLTILIEIWIMENDRGDLLSWILLFGFFWIIKLKEDQKTIEEKYKQLIYFVNKFYENKSKKNDEFNFEKNNLEEEFEEWFRDKEN